MTPLKEAELFQQDAGKHPHSNMQPPPCFIVKKKEMHIIQIVSGCSFIKSGSVCYIYSFPFQQSIYLPPRVHFSLYFLWMVMSWEMFSSMIRIKSLQNIQKLLDFDVSK